MLALWMGTGVIANPPVYGGLVYRPARRKRKAAENEPERFAEEVQREALRQAQEALEAQEDRDRYERRLEALAMVYAPRKLDESSIFQAAAKAVADLYDEIAAEFDELVIRMHAERQAAMDEDEAIALLLIALEA